MLARLLVALLMVNGAPGQGQEEDEECGRALSCAPFDDLMAATQYYCRCNMPTHKLNVNCLLESCPALSGLCPLTPDKCINETALTRAVSHLNECVGQKGLTCGLNLTRIPLVPISWTLAQLVPSSVVTGTCVQKPGDGSLDNFSEAQFTLSGTTGPISLMVRAPVTCEAVYNCTFEIAPSSFLTTLLGIMPSLNILNTPRMSGFYHLNLSYTVSIDLSTAALNIKTLDDQSDVDVKYTNFVNCAGMALGQKIEDSINLGMNKILKKSVGTSAGAELLSTYAALGLQAAQLNCP